MKCFTGACVRAILLLSVTCTSVLGQQSPNRVARGSSFRVGPNIGSYHEWSEGYSTTATGAVGVTAQFTGRSNWGVALELFQTGTHCRNTPSAAGRSCHGHRGVNVDVVRRFGDNQVVPYIAIGCCLVHTALGAEVRASSRMVVVGSMDLNWILDTATIRPKLALQLVF